MKTLPWIMFALAVVGGFVGGYAMSGGWALSDVNSAKAEPARSPAEDLSGPNATAAGESAGLAEVVHRFPLTRADQKETLESAALAITDDGRVHAAWASRVGPDEWQTFFTSSTDGGRTFAPPRVVAKSAVHRVTSQSRGKSITRELRMLPRLASFGNTLILGWVEAVDDNTRVKYFVARSTDGGKTFQPPLEASLDPDARPTYTGLAAGAEGAIAASWLDHRRKVQLPAASVLDASEDAFGRESLMHAPEDGGGVCPCCPTDLAFSSDGTLYVAFRNQKEGYRDIWIARLPPGASEFEPAQPIVSPRWQFDGCPHDGPSLAVVNGRMHIAWMDASSGQPRVHLGHGSLDLEAFEFWEAAPQTAFAQGHPALFADEAAALHLVWDEGSSHDAGHGAGAGHESGHGSGHAATSTAESVRLIRYATFGADGKPQAEPSAVAPLASGFQTRPTVAVAKDGGVFVAWVELTTEGKFIAVARLKIGPEIAAVGEQ